MVPSSLPGPPRPLPQRQNASPDGPPHLRAFEIVFALHVLNPHRCPGRRAAAFLLLDYSRADGDLFAIAGVWRPTPEWGDVFAMVMVDSCPQMTDVHDRMPVILCPEHWSTWTQATPEAAFALVQTCDDELEVSRTLELWGKPGSFLSASLAL